MTSRTTPADAAAGSRNVDQKGELQARKGDAETEGDVCKAEILGAATSVAKRLENEDGVKTACNALEKLYAKT